MSTIIWVVLAIAVVVALVWYGDRIQKREQQPAQPAPQPIVERIDYDLITQIVKERLQEEFTEEVVQCLHERVLAEIRDFAPADFETTPIDAPIEETTDVLFRPKTNMLPQELQDIGVFEGTKFAVAKDATLDVSKVPHWLVAGATGQGKSSILNTILLQAIQRDPRELQLVLLDPKRVEFAAYDQVPHLWAPVATEMADMITVLQDVVAEMEQRYTLMQAARVRNIDSLDGFPRIMVVIDELGDLMLQQGKIVEPLLIRLTQLGRAAGIHVIAATQRPSVDVITGVLKANLPGRIALRTASAVDSRVIIDRSGAEDLSKPGEFIMVAGVAEQRGRGVFVDEQTVDLVAS